MQRLALGALVPAALAALAYAAATKTTTCPLPAALMPSGKHDNELILPPLDTASQPAWLAQIRAWRHSCLRSIAFNGSAFELPGLAWRSGSAGEPAIALPLQPRADA